VLIAQKQRQEAEERISKLPAWKQDIVRKKTGIGLTSPPPGAATSILPISLCLEPELWHFLTVNDVISLACL
jgi:hypothetical protein